jgi:hypothetical protein
MNGNKGDGVSFQKIGSKYKIASGCDSNTAFKGVYTSNINEVFPKFEATTSQYVNVRFTV